MDRLLRWIPGRNRRHRDGQKETTVHGGVQGAGSAGSAAGARQRAGDRRAARASSEPGDQTQRRPLTAKPENGPTTAPHGRPAGRPWAGSSLWTGAEVNRQARGGHRSSVCVRRGSRESDSFRWKRWVDRYHPKDSPPRPVDMPTRKLGPVALHGNKPTTRSRATSRVPASYRDETWRPNHTFGRRRRG